MTVKEFWDLVDAIDVDSREDGKYTEDEMYMIGNAFIEMDNSQKREVGGWDKLVEVLHPLDRDGEVMVKGDTFRQWIKNRRYQKDEMIHNDNMLSGQNIHDISFSEFQEKTEELKRNLYKQQVKTRDVMNSYRRTLRDEARIEEIKSMIEGAISKLPELNIEPFSYGDESEGDGETEAVMLISDMHIGMQIDNFANKYNNEIAKKRLDKYVRDTIKICKDNHVQRLNVMNLNDLIDGMIHVTGRIEQESDVVDQVIIAAEYIAQALEALQEAAPEVIYRGVTDNHSRVNVDYKEHIEKESFCKFIDFYLEARLKGSKVVFAHDNLDVDISMFELLNGKTMICAHGHRDNLNTILQGYIGATRKFIDYICVGHYHESKMKTFQGAKVFVNGSICGSSTYSISKRLFGDPEQTLLIFSGNNLAQYVIGLGDA